MDLSSQRDKSILDQKEIALFGHGTFMRHCKGIPYSKETDLLRGDAP